MSVIYCCHFKSNNGSFSKLQQIVFYWYFWRKKKYYLYVFFKTNSTLKFIKLLKMRYKEQKSIKFKISQQKTKYNYIYLFCVIWIIFIIELFELIEKKQVPSKSVL